MRSPDNAPTGSAPEPSKRVSCHFPDVYKLTPTEIRRKRAERKVAIGVAIWINVNAIQLTEAAMDQEYVDSWLFKRNQAAQSQRGYDGIRRSMTLQEMAEIPIVNPVALLAPKGAKPRATYGRTKPGRSVLA
jgi:hypothetical protein